VRLGRRGADGATLRDHLLAAERAGIDTGELTPPPIPPGGEQILDIYGQLRRSAGSNGMAPNPVTLHDVQAWQALYGVTLEPAEIDWLFDIDVAVLAAMAESD
jgi:hypothetical protein